MATDNHNSKNVEHPINRSPEERARYLMMLGRWARGDITDTGRNESGGSAWGNGAAK